MKTWTKFGPFYKTLQISAAAPVFLLSLGARGRGFESRQPDHKKCNSFNIVRSEYRCPTEVIFEHQKTPKNIRFNVGFGPNLDQIPQCRLAHSTLLSAPPKVPTGGHPARRVKATARKFRGRWSTEGLSMEVLMRKHREGALCCSPIESETKGGSIRTAQVSNTVETQGRDIRFALARETNFFARCDELICLGPACR